MGASNVRSPVPFLGGLLFLVACQSVGTTTAILYNDQGHYDRAATVARDVIAENPDDAEAHFQLGLAYSHLDSVAEAYDHFHRSFELDPNDARRHGLAENNIQHNFVRHFSGGQIHFESGAYASAARAFEVAVSADPRRGVGYYNLGVTYARMAEGAPGFRDEAVAALEKAVQRSTPDDEFYTRAIAALARNLARMDLPRRAIPWGERYVELDPDNTDMWLLLSDCHEQLGNREQARACQARARRD